MKPKSQTLFHFTRSLEILQSILTEGFWPRYSLEDFRWQMTGPRDVDFAAFPMVCFCDIPLSRIDEHVEFYGHYGIGLSRAWAEASGLNPLLYVASVNSIARSLISLADVSRRHTVQDDSTLAMAFLQHAASFMKPVAGQMTLAGKSVEKDFYQESEWRFVPSHAELLGPLMKAQYDEPTILASRNQKAKDVATLRFSLSDIRYIFVQYDREIPAIVNFIQTALDMHSGADTKVLMSRVTSLETLRGDW